MLQEKLLFEKALEKAKAVSKYTGIHINYERDPSKKTFVGRLRKRWFYVANFICVTTAALSVFGLINAMNIRKILYMLPCMAFCFLGALKSYYFLYYEDLVRYIIKTLKNLQSIDESEEKVAAMHNFVKKHLHFLNTANNVLLVTSFMALATFCIGPLVIIGWQYWSTNEINLFLPYTLWYPFDEYSYVGWLFAYVHQFWAAWLAIFLVYGPDCFYYTACTFIYRQFYSLQFDINKIGPHCFVDQHSFNIHIEKLIRRHRELIRCVNMVNVIFGKSSLYNVVSSSFLICMAGFNVIAIENPILMTPFAVFVVFTSVQIFLLCYYGDLLMRGSLEVSVAVFSSKWYKLNVSSMKCCLFIIMRAQEPCKITALSFRDIDLTLFAKILSTAWSYFTLIKTMYSKQNYM